jgi:hypothetical protein
VTIHSLEFSDVVVKRFGSYDRGEHLREWRSLRLLDRHSPGLAPRPLAERLLGLL